ncbi:MAG: coproporphyrinogen dehydrogenase HemZ, partial [Clostridia bacterium]|nr:coproporphyrinogen dehydrogenase HemZ [Clostridia bacterium]
RALSEKFGKTLPWGALTGIRPTRLAYAELEQGKPFEPLFREMGVSRENISLVERTLEGQRGIYERKEGNCDLFVSLPFCPTKCAYCSFVTAPIAKTRQYLPDYLKALKAELQAAQPLIGNLRSVYVGGGTPFALSVEELREVFEAIAPLRQSGCEYTVEAGRPDVFTREKLQLCKDYGVTRICINAQSFSDRTLQTIGRSHTGAQVEEAFALAAPFGFTVNCDLIAGLTGESYEEFCRSVKTAISLVPENVTVHTLCLKKGAKLKEEVSSLAEGCLAEMIAFSREALSQAGYEPYYLYRQKYMAGAHENVGWAKRGFASVYNVDVMEESADNLAVGANAVSKRIFSGEGRIERIGSPKDIPTYLNKVEKLIQEKNGLFA